MGNFSSSLRNEWFESNGSEMKMLFHENRSLLNLRDKRKNTKLIKSCYLNLEDDALFLIEKGANLNCINKRNQSALYYCCIHGSMRIVKALITKGVDMNNVDRYGNTPLMIALKSDKASIARLLIESGADINTETQFGVNPFVMAVIYNHVDIAKLMIEKGLNLNMKKSQTSLSVVSRIENVELVKLLLEKGAIITDELLYIGKYGNLEILKIFVEHGANIHVQDKHQRTALHIALHYNKIDIVEFLYKQGLTFGAEKHKGYKDIEDETHNYFEDYEGYREYRMINEEK